MRVMDPLRLYPGWWRVRYGDEVGVLLEDRPPTRRDRVDLVRGAADAWLHPPIPSRIPAVAALVGGGLWTMLAAIVALQPVPADWPGYVLEIVPLAVISALALGIATVGCGLRQGDGGGRAAMVALAIASLGYVAWTVALVGTFAGHVGPVPLAIAQTLAMAGTGLVGLALVRAGDEPIGGLVAASALLLLIPSSLGWLAFGGAWTVIGVIELLGRRPRTGPAGLA